MLRKLAEALDNRHERKSLERLAASFNEQMQAYADADSFTQIGSAMSARALYHAFLTKYPAIHDFSNAAHSEKAEYLAKLSNYVERQSKGESFGNHPQGVTNGAVLVQFWITALAWGDFELADAMAEQLEPLNRMGYEMAYAMGQARPDEKVIAEWKEKFGENIDPYSLMDEFAARRSG